MLQKEIYRIKTIIASQKDDKTRLFNRLWNELTE